MPVHGHCLQYTLLQRKVMNQLIPGDKNLRNAKLL